MFDLTDLRAFARIADLSSISGAARSLRMPKSSVSRSLVRLEDSIVAVLVERSTRHLRLTDAGLLLQRHARRILDDVGEAENAIGGLVGHPTGDLRVSAPFTFAAGPFDSGFGEGEVLPRAAYTLVDATVGVRAHGGVTLDLFVNNLFDVVPVYGQEFATSPGSHRDQLLHLRGRVAAHGRRARLEVVLAHGPTFNAHGSWLGGRHVSDRVALAFLRRAVRAADHPGPDGDRLDLTVQAAGEPVGGAELSRSGDGRSCIA